MDDPVRWRDAGPNTHLALAATRQALDDAGLFGLAGVDPTRFGVYLGAGEGTQDFHCLLSMTARSYRADERRIDPVAFSARAGRGYQAGRGYEQGLHTTTARVADCFGLEGPNYSCLTACAAGSQALGEALEMVRGGDADLMLAGGSHSMIHPLGVTGFNLLTALSTRNDAPERASRPFDLDRDGFVIGEGAGVLILEELGHARRRGARVLAELTGYGSTADAFRMTDNHPEGRGAIACMAGALADAGLRPEDVGYINAHGTSTKVNDKVETAAIKKVFGEIAYKIPVSSTKSMIGHLIAAAGAVELITCVEAIRRGRAPSDHQLPDAGPRV